MDSSYISQRSFPDKNSKNLSTAPMSPPLSPKSSSSTTSTKKSFKISDIIIINSNLRSGNDNDNDNNVNDIPIANSYHYCRRRQQQQQQQQPSPPSDHHHLYENAFHSYTKTTTNENLNSIIIDTTGNRISPICDTSNGKSFFNNPNTTITNLSSSGSTLYNVNTNTNGVSNNSNFYPIRNSNNGYDYYSNNNNNNNNNSFNNHIYNTSSVCDINTKKSRMDINFIIDDDIMNNDNDVNDNNNNNDIRRHDENNNNKNDNVESEIDIRFFNNNNNNNNNNIYSYIGNNNDYNHHNKYKNKYDFNSSSNRFRLPSINEISGFEFNQEQIFLDSFGGGNNNGGCGDGNGNGSGGGRMGKTTSNNKNKRSSDEINNNNDNDNYRNQITKSPSKKVKRSGTSSSSSSSQRKGKGNSLARVMADRGLLRTSFNADITAAEIKSVRIPPPPSLSFDELMLRINQLQLDTRVLDTTVPSITWKGHPLQIEHLPHYNALHPTEALVVSILRLTPIQYLTGKHTLISSARRYIEKDLPFKKSDAQKLLRIDVNKASKLWDFFHQMNWIQL